MTGDDVVDRASFRLWLAIYADRTDDTETTVKLGDLRNLGRLIEADRYELTRLQAAHVLAVLTDADTDRCPECGPIKEDLEGWLKR